MMNFWKRTSLAALIPLIPFAISAFVSGAQEWTKPVDVLFELQKCVSYRARVSGDTLVVQAKVHPPWHTFVMDNMQRAAEKLAGRQSLGIDLPTEIKVVGGLEALGPWHQTPPKDFSNPAMRWFSWGYDDQAFFVTKVRRSGKGPARIAIRGQACTDMVCRNIDVEISLPLGGEATDPSLDVDLTSLVRVRP
jgi:hypothetical protein